MRAELVASDHLESTVMREPAMCSSDDARRVACLFCKQAVDQPSVEHVIPAGLGQHADIVLPPGAVCEPCNNTLGRQIDEALVHLLEVRLIRGYYGVPDQHGRRLTELPLANGMISFPQPEHVEVTVHSDRDLRHADAGSIVITAMANRKKSGDQWRRAARAILKMGLALVGHAHGSAAALDPSHDRLRGAIWGEPYDSYLLIGKFDIFQPPDLQARLRSDIPGIPLAAQLRYGGVDLIADLHLGAETDASRAWASDQRYQVMRICPQSPA